MEYIAKTDVGKKRINNEDSYFVKVFDDNFAIYVVADGLGGYESGEIASSMLIDSIKNSFSKNIEKIKSYDDAKMKKFISQSIIKANSDIFELEKTDKKYSGMGTTITLLVKLNEKLFCASVGDSRVYHIDDKLSTIKQITEDDTYVNELIKGKIIDKSEASTHPKKHILTKAVGVFENIDVTVEKIFVDNGYLMLCSDGLYNMLSANEILKIFSENNFSDLANKLVDSANQNGGSDNITTIVIKL